MAHTGRNDPCPCGSGRKYKHCCMGKDDGAAATPIVEVDSVVTATVVKWVLSAHKDRTEHVRPLLSASTWGEQAIPLVSSLLAWETPSASGEPLCHTYPEHLRRRFDPREDAWFEEQCRSWYSLWDVIEVRRDEGLFLHDLLTGEERFVRERSATRHVTDRSALLARTARLGEVFTLQSAHPAALSPTQAEQVADEARRKLKLGRGRVDPARLRGEAAFRLARLWDEAVEAAFEAPPPHLTNTDGEPLDLLSDMYEIQPMERPEVLRRLRSMSEVESDDADPDVAEAQAFHEFVWLRPGEGDAPRTELARMSLSECSLQVDSNSERRLDGIQEHLDERLRGLVRYLGRDRLDPEEPALRSLEGDDGPPIDLAEVNRAILAWKTQHYATWPDIPLPALDGLTPREAARDKRRKVYRQLDIVLREIEQGESRMPFEQRYDVGILRRELGLS